MEYDFWGALFRVILFLPIVAGLAFLFIKVGLSRKSLKVQGKNITVLESVALTPKAKLVIVKVEEKYMLLGVTENEIKLMSYLDDYSEKTVSENNPRFAEYLKHFTKGGSGE